jgi:hypothetical protein
MQQARHASERGELVGLTARFVSWSAGAGNSCISFVSFGSSVLLNVVGPPATVHLVRRGVTYAEMEFKDGKVSGEIRIGPVGFPKKVARR